VRLPLGATHPSDRLPEPQLEPPENDWRERGQRDDARAEYEFELAYQGDPAAHEPYVGIHDDTEAE